MARRPYSTRARPFKDSDEEVTLRWYPVVEPVECLPFPSKINSLDWSSHPWMASGVGEVWNKPRAYNGAKALPYAHGLTPCEPAEVFRDGEVLDPDKPPQLYNADHFPLCCLNQATMNGGLLWNGAAVVFEIPEPGGNCQDGGILELGIWYPINRTASPAPFQNYFWKWVGLNPAKQYRMRFEVLTTVGTNIFNCGAERNGGAFPCASFSPIVSMSGSGGPGSGFDEVRTLGPGYTSIAIGFSFGLLVSAGTFRMRVDELP